MELKEFEEPSLILVEDSKRGKLYLGNRHTAESMERLAELGITRVVNAAPAHVKGPSEGAGGSIRYHLCDLQDAPKLKAGRIEFDNVRPFVEPAVEFIAEGLEKGENVLVHCAGGISRSATIVMAFLMLYKSGSKSGSDGVVSQMFECLRGLLGGAPQGDSLKTRAEEEGSKQPPMTLADALRLIQSRRPIVAPNAGFVRQLLAIELELFGETTVKDPISDHQRVFQFKDGS